MLLLWGPNSEMMIFRGCKDEIVELHLYEFN